MAAPAYNVISTTTSSLATTESAVYSCVFTNLWSSARHPQDYPASAHWSPPILATHDDTYQMWAPGTLASLGVERVAEVGDTSELTGEITGAAPATGEFVQGVLTRNNVVQQQTFTDIELFPETPLLSTITMIAPSPDWFTGFYDYSPIDDAAGFWYEKFTIETYPFDAGTEEGETYSIDNDPEVPPQNIQQLTAATVPSTGVFLNTDNPPVVLPVASWTCTLEVAPTCIAARQPCSNAGVQCCSGSCALGQCRTVRTATSKTAVRLGNRNGRGGAAGRARGGRRLKGESINQENLV